MDLGLVVLTGGNDLAHLAGAANPAPERDATEARILDHAARARPPGARRVPRAAADGRADRRHAAPASPATSVSRTRSRSIDDTRWPLRDGRVVNSFHDWGIERDAIGPARTARRRARRHGRGGVPRVAPAGVRDVAPGTGTQGPRRRRPGPRPPRTRDACARSSSRPVKARGCGRTPSTAPSASSRWPASRSSHGRPTRCDAAVSTTSPSSRDTAPTRSRRSATRPCTTRATPRRTWSRASCARGRCSTDPTTSIVCYGDLVYEPRHVGRSPRARRPVAIDGRPRVASPVGAAHGRPAAGRGDAAPRRAREPGRARAEARRATTTSRPSTWA